MFAEGLVPGLGVSKEFNIRSTFRQTQAGMMSFSGYAFKNLEPGPRKQGRNRQAISQEADKEGVAKSEVGRNRGRSRSSANYPDSVNELFQLVFD